MKRLDMNKMAETICDGIREEREATNSFVRDVYEFVQLLPDDLENGWLNERKGLLLTKCVKYFENWSE